MVAAFFTGGFISATFIVLFATIGIYGDFRVVTATDPQLSCYRYMAMTWPRLR